MYDRFRQLFADDREESIRRVALIAGPLLAAIMLLLPPPTGLSQTGWAVAAISVLMGLWWMTEALPLAATALIPLALFPLFGISPVGTAASAYANPLIFLFLGGFLMAKAMVRHSLSERLAFGLLSVGSFSPSGIIASMMIATAFLSMWVSNTATTIIMLPIGQSIVSALQVRAGKGSETAIAGFATGLMLAIAYSATIGGMGTLIGTPPNALFAGFMAKTYGIEIAFWRWMMIGVPAVLVMLPLTWFLLTRVFFSARLQPGLLRADLISREANKLGVITSAEILVSVILVLAAFCWISRDLISGMWPGLQLSDAGIAVMAALLLFFLPNPGKPGERLLTWEDAQTIRWDVLILFGGGLSLADAINQSGLAAWIGGAATALSFLPLFLFLLGLFIVIVLLGEFASNTAVAAIFLPVAGASAAGLGLDPVMLAMPVALAATLGFMLPVATPPNAIIYGSGAVKVRDMLKVGAVLDIIGIIVMAVLVTTIGPMIF